MIYVIFQDQSIYMYFENTTAECLSVMIHQSLIMFFFFNNVFVCACMMALPQVGGNINQVGNQLNDRQNVRLDPSAALVSE